MKRRVKMTFTFDIDQKVDLDDLRDALDYEIMNVWSSTENLESDYEILGTVTMKDVK